MKTILTRLALATFFATTLAAAGMAFDFGGEGGWGSNDCCCCTTSTNKFYRMPSGKKTNIRSARKQASAAPPRATTPAKRTAPKPRKKVNFTLKKK